MSNKSATVDPIEDRRIQETVLENAPLAIWYLDTREGRLRFVNPPFARALGMSQEAILETTGWEELLGKEAARECRRSDQACLEADAPRVSHESLVFADGHTHELEVTKAPVKDKRGETIGIVGLAADVTRRSQVIQQLKESEETNQVLFEQTPIGLALCRMDGRFVRVNPAFARTVGYTVDELLAMHYGDITPGEYADIDARKLQELETTGVYAPYEKEYIRKDGRRVDVRLRGTLVERRGKRFTWSSVEDITAKKRAERALRESEQLYRNLFDSASEAILMMDGDRFIDCNPQTLELFGCSREDIINQPPYKFSPPEQPDGTDSREKALAHIEAALAGEPQKFEWRHQRLDGTPFDVLVTLNRVQLEGRTFVQAILRDITERKQAEEQLRYQAHFDTLTGLPNRVLAFDRISQAITRARRVETPVAVLFIDLDGFKHVNDTWGHAAGDRALGRIARRLASAVRAQDTIARLSGDEFLAVLPDLAQPEDAGEVASKLIDAVNEPLPVDGATTRVGASIGITTFPGGGENADQLIHRADKAMYAAKTGGRNTFRFYSDLETS